LFPSTRPDNSFTRLNPLVKIVILASAAVTVFFIADLRILAVFLAAVLWAILFFRIEFGRAMFVVKLYIMGLPVLVGLFVLSYLWREPTMTEGLMRGLAEGARYALRFLTLIMVNFAVVLSTDPREIITALRVLRIPEVVSQILAHVINLLPRLAEELRDIVDAQRARGMRFSRMWRPSNWLPVVLPVVLAAMRYSEQTAISLELRGGMDHEDASLPSFATPDWIVTIASVLLAAASVVWYYKTG